MAEQTARPGPAELPGPDEPPGPDELRQAMGLFATGVTIVTGLDDGEPVGFTCQAFASVSLEPPLVLFCAGHRGRSWPRIRRCGRFTVNVLDAGQADLCARFGSRAGHKFEGLEWELSSLGTPALPGALACVHAEISAVHQAGDHDIVVGLVREVACAAPGRPLLFYRGQFGLEPGGDDLPHALMAPGLWAWA